jgi:hypothetical protein
MRTRRSRYRGTVGVLAGALLLALAAGHARASGPVQSVAGLVQDAQAELAAHPGRAVLDYERARLLAPRAPEIRDGLVRARTAAGLPAARSPSLVRAAEWLSPDEWSRIALLALALGAVAVTAAAWRLWRRSTVPVAVAGLVLALAAGGVAWRTAPGRTAAVVVGANTVSRIAPFLAADEAFVAPEGSRVDVRGTHQGFVRIASDRGEGWVPSSAVETIIPRS